MKSPVSRALGIMTMAAVLLVVAWWLAFGWSSSSPRAPTTRSTGHEPTTDREPLAPADDRAGATEGGVRGIVLTRSGQPLDGAQVDRGEVSRVSAADGSFTFPKGAKGDGLLARAGGFGTVFVPNVLEGEFVTILLDREVRVTGRITDARDGSVIASARVRARSGGLDGPWVETASDATGTYALHGIEAKRYGKVDDIYVSAEGFSPAVARAPAPAPGRVDIELDFALTPAYSIAGVVLDGAKPVAGARVVAVFEPFHAVPDLFETKTGEDGSFLLRGLPLRSNGFGPSRRMRYRALSYIVGQAVGLSEQLKEAEPGRTDRVSIVLSSSARVTLRGFDEQRTPIGNIGVRARPLSDGYWKSVIAPLLDTPAYTSVSGDLLAVTNRPGHRATLSTLPTSMETADYDIIVWSRPSRFGSLRGISVRAGALIGPVDVILRGSNSMATVSLGGIVRDPAGNPAAGATVRVNLGWKAVCDAEGRFQIPLLPTRQNGADIEIEARSPAGVGSVRVSALSGGEHRDDVEVLLHRLATITGRVQAEGGDPIEGASVNLYLANRPLQARSPLARRVTDSSGLFKVEVPAGQRYDLRVEARDARLYPGRWKVGTAFLVDILPSASPVVVTLVPGELGQPGTIAGKMVLANGRRPLAGWVEATPLSGGRRVVAECPRGEFLLTSVPSGKVRLRGFPSVSASPDGVIPVLAITEQIVDLAAGATIDNVVLEVSSGSTLELECVDDKGDPVAAVKALARRIDTMKLVGNSVPLGGNRLDLRGLPAGRHRIEVVGPHGRAEVTVTLDGSEKKRLRVELQPLDSLGELTVQVARDARIDSVAVALRSSEGDVVRRSRWKAKRGDRGPAEVKFGRLPAGRYSATVEPGFRSVRQHGYRPKSFDVTLAPGERRTVALDFRPR